MTTAGGVQPHLPGANGLINSYYISLILTGRLRGDHSGWRRGGLHQMYGSNVPGWLPPSRSYAAWVWYQPHREPAGAQWQLLYIWGLDHADPGCHGERTEGRGKMAPLGWGVLSALLSLRLSVCLLCDTYITLYQILTFWGWVIHPASES